MPQYSYESPPLASSSTPLISDDRVPLYTGSSAERQRAHGEGFDDVPAEKRQLGVMSVVSLIINRMIGTGIYSTPSVVLRASGSVGLFLVSWIIGAIVTSVGMAVYVEFGTALPRSGGEKNYLEYIYKKPKFLVTCSYAMYYCLLGGSTTSSIFFGEYMVHAFGGTISQWNTRLIGFACLTSVTLLHTFHLNWGLRLQNTLALVQLGIMLFLIMCGFLAFLGWIPSDDRPHNFDDLWKGTTHDPNAFVSGLCSVIWTFIGYTNAHYVLSETKDPVKTIKRAAPLAMTLITVLYLFVNASYLIVVSKEDILGSGRIVAALFFRNLFGSIAERVLSFTISISALANMLATCFAKSRVIQELGREGVLPYSSLLAKNSSFKTPYAALILEWALCTFWMFTPPPGDAYNFVMNLDNYPYACINTAISGGLLWLYLSPSGKLHWNPPYRAGVLAVTLFLLSNLFLTVVPLIPPSPDFRLYDFLPYWIHVAASAGVFFVGVIYWYVWARLLPGIGGYEISREVVIQNDGISRTVLNKIPKS
ncbi:high affinity methionine permease [Hysterangium stoloniferum]|nr:high affinity methionine permease [Hysterangium stoloniferum]